MDGDALGIAFFGSKVIPDCAGIESPLHESLVEALSLLGHRISLFNPPAFTWQWHRLVERPPFHKCGFYETNNLRTLKRELIEAGPIDVLVSLGSIDRFDARLEHFLVRVKSKDQRLVRWDIDAPKTLNALFADRSHPIRSQLHRYDLVLAEGGGKRVEDAYRALGARRCARIPPTIREPVREEGPFEERFLANLAMLGGGEADVTEEMREYVLGPAIARPSLRFLIGGVEWKDTDLPDNVSIVSDVRPCEHGSFFRSPTAVFLPDREGRKGYGYAPTPELLSAAASGACILTEDWAGIEDVLEPEREVLLVRDGEEVVRTLDWLSPSAARIIGTSARHRVIKEQTVPQRAQEISDTFVSLFRRSANGRHRGFTGESAEYARPRAVPDRTEPTASSNRLSPRSGGR